MGNFCHPNQIVRSATRTLIDFKSAQVRLNGNRDSASVMIQKWKASIRGFAKVN